MLEGKTGLGNLAIPRLLSYSVVVFDEGTATKAVIVVADDDRSTCHHLSTLLRAEGHEVLPVYGGQKAIDAVRERSVDLAVLDVAMPGLGGIDACKVIKSITHDRFVPVILLTVQGDRSGRLQGSSTGADDHLGKPVQDAELIARVANMLRVKRAHDDVAAARRKLKLGSNSGKDEPLPNRRQFHEALERSFEEAKKALRPLACCILAVDDFRRFADERGPEFASLVLDAVSGRLQTCLRETDLVAQFRAAEFGVLMSDSSPAKALTVADRVIAEIASHPVIVGSEAIQLKVSIGVGLYPSLNVRTHSELLDAASIAVARARVAGPNRVCVVQQQGYIFRPTLPGAA